MCQHRPVQAAAARRHIVALVAAPERRSAGAHAQSLRHTDCAHVDERNSTIRSIAFRCASTQNSCSKDRADRASRCGKTEPIEGRLARECASTPRSSSIVTCRGEGRDAGIGSGEGARTVKELLHAARVRACKMLVGAHSAPNRKLLSLVSFRHRSITCVQTDYL